MNLFGFEIKWSPNSNGNGRYVKQMDCHRAMDDINVRIDDHCKFLTQRFDDIKSEIDLVVSLLKK